MCEANSKQDIIELFNSKQYLRLCAPMVRYSKVQFRNLVMEYGCDLCYTPMILADSFCQSNAARFNEFSTNQLDQPVIAQFAASSVHDFVGAAYLISPYCNGVDLNCGCPQSWAKQQGIGSSLLNKPDIISDLIKQCRNRIPNPFSVSVKIRIKNNDKDTISLCQQIEHAGASFIAVHARTASQKTGVINADVLGLIKDCCDFPIVANGGLKTIEDCDEIVDRTSVDGVMIANGILSNPAIFAGYKKTPLKCVKKWLDICYNSTLCATEITSNCGKIPERPRNLTFQCFHHHLVFMMESILSREERRVFNNYKTFADVLQFLADNFGLQPQVFDEDKFSRRAFKLIDYSKRDTMYKELTKDFEKDNIATTEINYNSNHNDGIFFKSKLNIDNDDEFTLTEIFENG